MTSKVTSNLHMDGEDGAAVKGSVAATNITVDLTGTVNSASAATVTPTNKNSNPSRSASKYHDMIKDSGVALFDPQPKKLKYSSASSEELEGLHLAPMCQSWRSSNSLRASIAAFQRRNTRSPKPF